MTETKGACPENYGTIPQNGTKEELNNNVLIIKGVTEGATSDFSEENELSPPRSGQTSKTDCDVADENNVIHSFMQNTSDEVRVFFFCVMFVSFYNGNCQQ